jgi:hypothetical protein
MFRLQFDKCGGWASVRWRHLGDDPCTTDGNLQLENLLIELTQIPQVGNNYRTDPCANIDRLFMEQLRCD